MSRKRSRLRGLAVAVAVSLLLVGCVKLPQPSDSAEDLVGVWEFVDSDGVTSTMVIEPNGQFTVDLAPIEAFSVQGNLEVGAWDGEVDWHRAVPITGDVSVDGGRITFRTVEWGAIRAYESGLRGDLEFAVGDPDYQVDIAYARVE